MPSYDKPSINLSARLNVALAIVCFLFAVIVLRLWFLQIVKGDYFRDQSENNRIRQVFVTPPRGLILDRNGVTLAKNRPAFQVDIVREDTFNLEETVDRLAAITNRDSADLMKAVKSPGKRRPFEPRMVLKDISREMVASIESRRWELPGVQVSVIPARSYPFNDLAAHVIGYIGEISSKQLEKPGYVGYRMGDVVGQSGIEARWEKLLQGQRGIQEVVVNAMGTKIGQASFESEKPGKNIVLTIDKDVQAAAELALGERKGAVIALDPRTGEVIALTSGPRYDPNMFVGEIPRDAWVDVIQGEGRKLTNRAVQGTYPPGSVFKVFMEAAALSEGVMTKAETTYCPGHMQVGNRRFHCHKRSGHGSLNHFGALVQSCDIYFYIAGTRLGVDRIHAYATRFGLGSPTGLELVDESSGTVPSTEWKRKRFRDPEQQKWYPGETPSVSIGQGAVTTTPIQIARAIAALVNGGTLYKPQLVKRVESADGKFLDDSFAPEPMGTLDLDPTIVETVVRDMVGVVNDTTGTGHRAQLPKELGVVVGGKTGTSQVVGLEHKGKAKNFEHHAWFAGFAPAESPELVVVALVENGGGGGATAAPVVREVMASYFYKSRGIVPSSAAAGGAAGTASAAAALPVQAAAEIPAEEVPEEGVLAREAGSPAAQSLLTPEESHAD
jgi:penicillin-binding protein 2